MLGRISDSAGRRPILLLSILISSISFLLFALANSFLMLLLSRVIAGMATESAVAQAYIADITSKKERATGMGKVGAAFGAGFIVGPAIGGFLSVLGFSAPGFAAFALTLLNLLFAFFFLPESIVQTHSGMQIASDSDEGYLRKLGNALARPMIGAVLVVLFIITLAFSAVPVILPLLANSFFGFEEIEMSYFFMYIGLIQIVMQGFLIGRLVKKFGEEKLIASGLLLMMLGIFFMPLIPSVAIFMPSLTMIAVGIGMMNTAVPTFISKRTPADEQGGMMGVTQSVSGIARIPGPIIGGLVFEFAGLATPFFLSAALLMVAFSLGCGVLQACTRSDRERTGVEE
jgi:predicted MFS family arabinose efflux permease